MPPLTWEISSEKRGGPTKPLLFYQKTAQLNPSNAGAHYCLAVALQEKGRFDDALNSYTKVLQMNPNHADTYNNIGSVLQEKGQLDEAVNYLSKSSLPQSGPFYGIQ